jgi:hypothetical protein
METRDLLLFVPGVNIVYMLVEGRRMHREIKQAEKRHEDYIEKSRRDSILLTQLADQRDAALRDGDNDTADAYDNRIVQVVLAHIPK